MMRFRAPPRPPDFPTERELATGLLPIDTTWPASLQNLYRRAEEIRSQLGKVNWDREKDRFDVWKEWKKDFREAQFDRCGFCQGDCSRQSGDVEHFAPKAEVRRQTRPGVEKNKKVSHGPMPQIATPGYWWRAYDWENWLYACEICNRKYKKNFFPIAESVYPPIAHGIVITPLLLNPYYGPDPQDHLEFDTSGQIRATPGSRYGRATIETCGLDSGTLQQQRAILASRTFERCRRIVGEVLAPVPTPHGINADIIAQTQELIKDTEPNIPYSSMVRSLIRQHLGVDWKQITHPDFTDNIEMMKLSLEVDSSLSSEQHLQSLGLDSTWRGLLERLKQRTTIP